MPFELSVVTKDELRDVVEMLFYAYDESSAFVNAVYPHKITEGGIEGLDMVVARLQYLIDIDPSIRWYKVTNSSTGEIISASQWNVYDKEKPQEMMLDGPPGSWATDEDKKYAIEMFESFIMPRYTRYRQVDLPIICKFSNESWVQLLLSHTGLNIMGTAKKYQYKGAATLQVKKFTALADELNAIVRRLCPHSTDLRLHFCPSDHDRVNHTRSMAVREKWVRIVQGAGSLDHRGRVARIRRSTEGVSLFHGAPQSKVGPVFVNGPVSSIDPSHNVGFTHSMHVPSTTLALLPCTLPARTCEHWSYNDVPPA
jgi:hypothetical protein